MQVAVYDLAERVGIVALAKTHGVLDEETVGKFKRNFKARLERKETTYPLYDALEVALPEVLEAGLMAAIATSQTLRRQKQITTQEWETPLSGQWRTTIEEEAAKLVAEHFAAAESLFRSGETLRATEELTHAVVCQVVAIAASKGWPHSSDQQISDAITALATGQLPDENADLYTLLKSASEEGINLISAFGAAIGQPDTVRFGLFYEGNEGIEEDSQHFAKRAIELANWMSGRTT